MLGHTLGASGGIELIACVLSIRHGVVHPTINYQTPDLTCDLDYVPNTARETPVRRAISNSFGFGGHNCCLVVGAILNRLDTNPKRKRGLSTNQDSTPMTSPLDSFAARAGQVNLSSQEVARYSRHLIMPEVGMDGQKRLKAASVLLIGAGGLGSPLGLYLAAAGVGRIGLVDFDVVDFSNLQRQVLHGTPDVGRPKLHSARTAYKLLTPKSASIFTKLT